jgi:hypothetical protein
LIGGIGGIRNITMSVTAVNRASNQFQRIATDAEQMTARIKSFGAALAGIGAAGTAVTYMAHQFGLLNAEQAKVLSATMMLISVMGMFMRTSMGVAVAQKVYAAACAVATAVQNALNISYATFLALTGVGVAVIVAAAAAMYGFASSMKSATASVQQFNQVAAETPARVRGITRTGEAELARRGIE